MISICMDDLIIRRAKNEQIATNTKAITNAMLCTVGGVLIGTGTIGIAVLGECVIIFGINKISKIIIKKTGIIGKIKENIRKGEIIRSRQ